MELICCPGTSAVPPAAQPHKSGSESPEFSQDISIRKSGGSMALSNPKPRLSYLVSLCVTGMSGLVFIQVTTS